jgi:hypothetical protein
MTDLEATQLCGEAMGLKFLQYEDDSLKGVDNCLFYGEDGCWAPLKNDEHAMALVKRFRLQIDAYDEAWNVAAVDRGAAEVNESLNRAIVYCVAAMQVATTSNTSAKP